MIAGVGVDMVSCVRIEQLHARWGVRFERRLLGVAECAQLPAETSRRQRAIALAFAAKEALAKALGTGLRWPASWHQIAVERDELGAPHYRFGAKLSAHLAQRGIARSHLSLTDDGGMAVAMVVLEQDR